MFLSVNMFAKEMYVESYVVSRLGNSLSNAPDFVSNGTQVKGVRITNTIVNQLGISDSPFYIKATDGREIMVRLGDYITRGFGDRGITVIARREFESRFSSVDGSVVFNPNEVLSLDLVDYTRIDESVDGNVVIDRNEILNLNAD